MTEETKFTVFVTASDGWTGFSSRGQTLQEVIDIAAEPAWGQTFTPLAWIAGKVADNDGSYDQLRAESIAAGRVIEHDGTRYVARGVEDKPAKSPHGSRLGDLVHMCGYEFVRNGAGFVWHRDLAKGEWPQFFAGNAEIANLVASAAKAHIVRKEKADPNAATPTLDQLANTSEPKRPRLTWADPQRVDRFPGFIVTKGRNADDLSDPEPFFDNLPKSTAHPALSSLSLSADLAPSSHQVLPGFGSAAILKTR